MMVDHLPDFIRALIRAGSQPNFYSGWITDELLQQTGSTSRVSTSSLYNKKSPSELPRQSIFVGASIISDLLSDSYKSRTPFELLQWMDPRRTSTMDGLHQSDLYSELLPDFVNDRASPAAGLLQ